MAGWDLSHLGQLGCILELTFCFTLQEVHSILLVFYQLLTAVGQALEQSGVRDKTLANTPHPGEMAKGASLGATDFISKQGCIRGLRRALVWAVRPGMLPCGGPRCIVSCSCSCLWVTDTSFPCIQGCFVHFLSLLASFQHHHPQNNDTETERGIKNNDVTRLERASGDGGLSHLPL